jgi:hypothetical protein
VPWCEDCAKYYAPSAMNPDGTCPSCGRPIDVPTVQPLRRPGGEGTEEDATEEQVRAPWHFKLLMVLLALYLTWRLVQLFT